MDQQEINKCRQLAEQYIVSHGGGEIERELGDGGSAVVFRWAIGEDAFALKVYDPSFLSPSGGAKQEAIVAAERNRLELQRRLIGNHCEFIVDILSVEEVLGTCFIKMEFYPGDLLKDVISEVPDFAVENLITQLVKAVIFLDGYGLVHRDIKPENILVSKDFKQLKLLDLGVVRETSTDEERGNGTDHGRRKPFIATAQYSSPEYLFRLVAPSKEMWTALTIYQVGAVLHDLVCKRPIFEELVIADNKYALAMAVIKERPSFSDVPDNLKRWAALAAKCLVKDYKFRLAIVSWNDFLEKNQANGSRFVSLLKARANKISDSNSAVNNKESLRHKRESTVESICLLVKQKILSKYSPLVRVVVKKNTESSSIFYLNFDGEETGVLIKLSYEWQGDIVESIAHIYISAVVQSSSDDLFFDVKKNSLCDIDSVSDDYSNTEEMILASIDNVLDKYSDLMPLGQPQIGCDLFK